MTPKLIACVLGGTAPGARTELHDVAFAVGHGIEEVHDQLLDAWFGTPEGLHVDAWTILDAITGYRVHLQQEAPENDLRLYFVNIGGYQPGEFGERHAWGFFGATTRAEAKRQAKATLLRGHESPHKDNLYQVDECIGIETLGRWHVCLQPDSNAAAAPVTNGYFPLPTATIRNWRRQRARRGASMGSDQEPS